MDVSYQRLNHRLEFELIHSSRPENEIMQKQLQILFTIYVFIYFLKPIQIAKNIRTNR